jgi:hypothetical protein
MKPIRVRPNYAKVTKEFKVRVIKSTTLKGWRWFTFRIKIAFLLIRLGAWVGGMGTSFEDKEQGAEG